MMKYMESFHLSLFELEVIKKDLIGMALEARLEGIDIMKRIGVPEKEFCDGIAENAEKRSLMEWLLPIVRNSIFVAFGFYILKWLLEGLPAHFGITNWTVCVACVAGGISLFDGWLRGRSVYMNRKKRNMLWMFESVLLMVLSFLFNFYIFSPPNGYFKGIVSEKFLIAGDGLIIFNVFLVLVTAVFLWNNCYWDRSSRKYRWE